MFQVITANYRVAGNGCWIWKNKPNSSGYGRIKIKQKSWLAHRLSFLMHYGHLTPGLQIDHLCRNRLCIKPTHLEEVTAAVNMYRSVSPVAVNKLKTHCIRGHEFTDSNTLWYKRPKRRVERRCILCTEIRWKSRYYGPV